MIGYAVIGSNDVEKAKRFYDPLVELLGGTQVHSFVRGVFYGDGRIELAVVTPFDEKPAQVGNGQMVALAASGRAAVDRAHALALELGGSDEGAPGVRSKDPDGFYGAYFRDPEGNKLCVYCWGPA
ncbi:VOC family protein [Croceicoccus sp. BE223]|uniref:VOC family protein n=1 Tax=Croceicoccus sp. BE223 TaxID=2817716 RepID=UPI0028627D59|nr:VOC family protein [Croceicoccus sp. BE223]MDR7103691.1 catechol 2,3-dioxygenase-like lactoylglutathione lyase family enzyme [Croceicoccus sp. BE223]